MSKKFHHEWSFMGNGEHGELQFCSLCNKWRWSTDEKFLFILPKKDYQYLIDNKKISGI